MKLRYLATALLIGAAAFAVAAPAAAEPIIPPDECRIDPCDPPPPPPPPVFSLDVNKVRYAVSEAPRYTVRHAAPNSRIFWSSTLNGQPTGEDNAYYGHDTNAFGFFSVQGGAFRPGDVGRWTKTVLVGEEQASTGFKVVEQCGYEFRPGKVFVAHESYDGCKGTFIMQGDGNLVVYDEFGVGRWSSRTQGNPGAYAAFQGDGNLVVYSADGFALWATHTRADNAKLAFQGDGNLVIYDQFGRAIFATHTGH